MIGGEGRGLGLESLVCVDIRLISVNKGEGEVLGRGD